MNKEYSNFNDIADANLQAWNRCSVAFNVAADDSMAKMREYLGQFSEAAREAINNMFERVKTDGYEKTKASVSREQNSKPHEAVDDNA